MLEPKKGTFIQATQETSILLELHLFQYVGKKKKKEKEIEMDANRVLVTRDFIAITVHASAVRVVHILCTGSTEVDSPWKPVLFEVSLL